MHIAVFDDNIADRKQTERLLKRQSDRYQNEGKEHFYIDSYGNYLCTDSNECPHDYSKLIRNKSQCIKILTY